ncbi:MAG: hypothetical protein A2X94_13785 [Bdellovibrionales bacterium GWB1_55_8]|nr:MAG: hypothetical protein A2X94_13785 [Bdellovibrionales bacterium GWB1_55_8]
MRQRVAITGLGIVSAIGNCVNEFADSLFAPKAGIHPITLFNTKGFPVKSAAEIRNFGPFTYPDRKVAYAARAITEAIAQSFGENGVPREKVTVLSLGLKHNFVSFPEMVSANFITIGPDECAQQISKAAGIQASPWIYTAACTASTVAIGTAARAVADGEIDVAIAGGTSSCVSPEWLLTYALMGALNTDANCAAETACRPFDRNRTGMILGEGAGFLILERESSARARNAPVLARICGFGSSLDAYHVSDPCPDGAGALSAMNAALKDARINPEDLSAINAHATGTLKNDSAEAAAIRRLLDGVSHETPVFATKPFTGHLLAASGAVETIAVVSCLTQQKLHPTLNLVDVASDCKLNHVLKNRHLPLRYILKNSFGFGGQNACMVLEKGDSLDE